MLARIRPRQLLSVGRHAECVRADQRYGGRCARAEEGVEDSLLRADLAAVAAHVRLCVTGSAKFAALTAWLVPTVQAAGTAMAEAARKPRLETRRDEGAGGRCGKR